MDKSGIREKTEFYTENAEYTDEGEKALDTDFHRFSRIRVINFFFFGCHPKIKSYFQFAPRAQNVNLMNCQTGKEGKINNTGVSPHITTNYYE